ncbi:hypothetical protein ACQKJZ_04415 [Sphingomonas sp. NPDC019816]|uniref:hypothetical protein n=1 Tax=Sphingomonas sp. NPDC019816 TaxID=3390679 RepID=UPI003D04400D
MLIPDEGPMKPERIARAVIEAIREPSSPMTHAAQSESHVAGNCEVDYHGIWASMIDALLEEGAMKPQPNYAKQMADVMTRYQPAFAAFGRQIAETQAGAAMAFGRALADHRKTK